MTVPLYGVQGTILHVDCSKPSTHHYASFMKGGHVAQLLQHQISMLQRQVWLPSVARGIFLPGSIFSADCYVCLYTPCATACNNICVHVKDPVVHVRVWWIRETLKHPDCTVSWAGRLLQLAFPKESNPNFPQEKSHQDNTVVKRLFWGCFFFLKK